MPNAVYPGSFDPLTNGHLNIIQRGLQLFEKVFVSIAENPKKTALFSVQERIDLIREACPDPRIEVDNFQGLLIDYATRKGACAILRGLRQVSDFEFEFQMANMNRKLSPKIETVFMMTGGDYFYISSHIVREVSSLGGSVEGLVPPNVLIALSRKFSRP